MRKPEDVINEAEGRAKNYPDLYRDSYIRG